MSEIVRGHRTRFADAEVNYLRAADELQEVTEQYEAVLEVKGELEKRIVGQPTSLAQLYEAAMRLETLHAAELYFLVNIETNFYRHYRAFFRRIMEKGTLAEITRAKEGMVSAINGGLITTLKIQGIVAVFALLLADIFPASAVVPLRHAPV